MIVKKSLKFSMKVCKTLYNITIPLSNSFHIFTDAHYPDLLSLNSARNLAKNKPAGTRMGLPFQVMGACLIKLVKNSEGLHILSKHWVSDRGKYGSES